MLLFDAVYSELLAKWAWHVQPVATIFGDEPFAVKVPSVFVITSVIFSAAVPSKVMVLRPTPPAWEASASLPGTVKSLPHGTFVIVLSVRSVWIGSGGVLPF